MSEDTTNDPLIIPDQPPDNKSQQIEITRTTRGEVPSCRMVIVETVHHQPANEDASTHTANYVRWLDNDEAVYNPNRKVRVSQQWQQVDTGWVESIGMLIIANRIAKAKMKKENVSDKKGVLEVCLSTSETEEIGEGVGMWASTKKVTQYTPHIIILPEETARFTPVLGGKVYIRCREGEGLYSVFALQG